MSNGNAWTAPADGSRSEHNGTTTAAVVYQTFGKRAAAKVIDYVVLAVVSIVATVPVLVAALAMGGNVDELAEGGGLFSLETLFGIIAVFAACTAGEFIGGVTPGKLALGMRVVSVDGDPIPLGGAALRNVGYLFDGLFFGMVGYGYMSKSEMQQRKGDEMGGSVVVNASSTPISMGRAALGVMAFLIVGTLVYSANAVLSYASTI